MHRSTVRLSPGLLLGIGLVSCLHLACVKTPWLCHYQSSLVTAMSVYAPGAFLRMSTPSEVFPAQPTLVSLLILSMTVRLFDYTAK